jgi:hypothetical protein
MKPAAGNHRNRTAAIDKAAVLEGAIAELAAIDDNGLAAKHTPAMRPSGNRFRPVLPYVAHARRVPIRSAAILVRFDPRWKRGSASRLARYAPLGNADQER